MKVLVYHSSEKESSHSSTRDNLSLMKNVVLVNEVHEVIATLLDTSHQTHKCCIVALSIKLWLEMICLQNGKSGGKSCNLSNDVVIKW